MSAGRLLLRLEDTRAVSAWMGAQEMLLGRVDDPDTVLERLDAVTPEDLRRVANRILATEGLNLAVVGPNRGQKRLERLLRLEPA